MKRRNICIILSSTLTNSKYVNYNYLGGFGYKSECIDFGKWGKVVSEIGTHLKGKYFVFLVINVCE